MKSLGNDYTSTNYGFYCTSIHNKKIVFLKLSRHRTEKNFSIKIILYKIFFAKIIFLKPSVFLQKVLLEVVKIAFLFYFLIKLKKDDWVFEKSVTARDQRKRFKLLT